MKKEDNMSRDAQTADAVKILHRRYVGDDLERRAALEQERTHANVARQIYALRTRAGLSQKELAERIGTTQFAISRLEDADYEGHSLSMLRRIAQTLGGRVEVNFAQQERSVEPFVFRRLLHFLRRSKGLTLNELAERTDVPREELAAIEQEEGYCPTPRTMHLLARFYRLSLAKLAALAGAIHLPIDEIREPAFRFAAMSETFSELSQEEKHALRELVTALREGNSR